MTLRAGLCFTVLLLQAAFVEAAQPKQAASGPCRHRLQQRRKYLLRTVARINLFPRISCSVADRSAPTTIFTRP